MKRKNFPPTTQHKIMLEDKISPLLSLLEDSEEADGALDFDLRQDYDTYSTPGGSISLPVGPAYLQD